MRPGRGGPRLRDAVLEADLLPDAIVRAGIRQILRQRLRQEDERNEVRQRERLDRFARDLRASPIAVQTDAARTQHYDVPAEFFELVLGPQMKYSCGLWSTALTLRDAEEAMLRLTCDRAELTDGQRILELGCGWGSLTLHVAERFPRSTIVAVSNSASQRAFIERRAAERGASNVCVVTADMNDFDATGPFDRIVSVEMFEHMRNHAALLARIARWLTLDGKLFVHIFTHSRFAYAYDVRGASDWMTEHFFTGGMMPSDDLLYRFQDDMRIEAHWHVNGIHYERTANAWLANMEANRAPIDRVLGRTYGAAEVARWRFRWRLFFMACAELFGFRGGTEWMVSHYRFVRGAAGS